MDRTSGYRDLLNKIVHEYAEFGRGPDGVETYPVIDPVRDVYSVLYTGWHKNRRINGCILQLELKNNKIWVQHDGTDVPVVAELESAGVPKSDIVLGFQPPQRRPLTGYAVG